MKLEHFLTLYTKINSKWIKDLNVRLETIKVLEENIGSTFFDINCHQIFSNQPSRVMKIKTKINKYYLIKPKRFCTAKEISPEYSLEGLMLKLKLQYFGHLM